MSTPINTVVIGGGQAGLATGYHLKQLDVDHVILDKNEEVGASWRNRWASLRLFTPAKYNSLPGLPYPGPPLSFPDKDDIADYLQTYVTRFELPVRNGVKVERVQFDGDRYIVETNDGQLLADNVVVATGAFHKPRIPEFAYTLNPAIYQVHSTGYRHPSQVPEGPVLVVGAGQSGAEIAMDLVKEHRVWLSGRDTGGAHFDRDSFVFRLVVPIMAFATTRVVNVANPIGRKVREKFLHPPRGIPRGPGTTKPLNNSEVEQVGRTTGTKDGYPQLEDGQVLKVSSVIWCTGAVTDYSWIDLGVFDDYGYPIHDRGVVESQPGLHFMGLMFQRSLSSVLFMGMGRDAEHVAEHIKQHRSMDTDSPDRVA